jgi:nucleotide-binding universal stress UspA family protein
MEAIMYGRIVVVLDETPRGEWALGWLRHLVRGPESIVHLLSVCPAGALVRAGGHVVAFADQVEDDARARATAYLESIAAGLRDEGLRVMTHVRFGRGMALDICRSCAVMLSWGC